MSKQAFIVVGLGYGDEGKGTTTDYLTRKHQAHTIIRFNGGSQAAHHVVTDSGITHCFAQFGSGTLVVGVRSYLSSYMAVDPLALLVENKVLEGKGILDALDRLTIDQDCLVTTPIHKLINQMQEVSRGSNRHGSCGKGVGQTILDSYYLKDRALFIRDLKDSKTTFQKLRFLWQVKLDLAQQLVLEQPNNQELQPYLEKLQNPFYVEQLTEAYQEFIYKVNIGNSRSLKEILFLDGTVIFEGAQGVLLDFERGFNPFITKSCTTFDNADKLLKENAYDGDINKIGVLRAYSTRHGAGPFVTEDEALTKELPDYHNGTNPWQRAFRVGWFDLVAASYACQTVKSLTSLAITTLDRLCTRQEWKVCTSYVYKGQKSDLLSKFFDISLQNNQEIITKIKTPPQTSSEYQKQLTELLKDCQPIYQDFEINNIEKYLSFISKNLSIPINILSSGVTAEDKQEINIKFL